MNHDCAPEVAVLGGGGGGAVQGKILYMKGALWGNLKYEVILIMQ